MLSVYRIVGSPKTWRDCLYKVMRIPLPKSTHDWVCGEQVIEAPYDFNRVEISVVYENQGGRARFDDIRLVTNPAP